MGIGIFNPILAAAALGPAFALCFYIYKKDRHEKEPIKLLLLLAGLGAASCFPAMILERIAGAIINALFGSHIYAEGAETFIDTAYYYPYHFVDNFFGIALIEEGCKWLVLFLVTRNNKNFDSLFDGVVYAVFVSLGFAALENVFYVFSNSLTVALHRAVTAVPGHMCFGVFMGYYYTFWHLYRYVRKTENGLISAKLVLARSENAKYNRTKLGWLLVLSIAVPTLIHGLYDFTLSIGSVPAVVLFYIGLAGLYVFCFLRIRRLSSIDADQRTVALNMLAAEYPFLGDRLPQFIAMQENPVFGPGYGANGYAAGNGTYNGGYAGNGGFASGNFAGNGTYGNGNFAGNGTYGNGNFTGNGTYGSGNFAGNGTYGNGNFTGNGTYGNGNFAGGGNASAQGGMEFFVCSACGYSKLTMHSASGAAPACPVCGKPMTRQQPNN